MKVAILTGGFPSQDNPSKSIFNYRAVIGLMKYVDVTVFHFRYWKPGRKFISNKNFNNVNVVEISLPWIPINFPVLNALNILLWNWLVIKLLRLELKKYEVLHSIGLEIALTVSVLASKFNMRHIAQTIGSDLLIYMPKIDRFFWLNKWTKNTDVVVCNSAYLKTELLKRYPNLKAKVIYRGTNLNSFYNRELKIDKPKVILYLGGFSKRQGSGMGTDLKGGETLKEIWKYFDGVDNLDVIIKLGGPSSNNRDQLEWRSQLDYPQRVELLGQLDPNLVPELIKKADVVLIPSKSEGLPNVAVEACASGALVIASNVGGIPEIVVDNYTGLLVDPNDKLSWIEKIKDVLNNYDSYHSLRNNAVEFTQKHFDANNYPKSLLEIYGAN